VAKVWVLDTDTKGTGANVVPLERVLKRGSDAGPQYGFPGFDFREPDVPRELADAPAEPRKPLEFKVVDVMSRRVLADGADARATLAALEGVRSVVDVTIYVWDAERERWQMLTLAETRALWENRGRSS
jgi:hypothetical protein